MPTCLWRDELLLMIYLAIKFAGRPTAQIPLWQQSIDSLCLAVAWTIRRVLHSFACTAGMLISAARLHATVGLLICNGVQAGPQAEAAARSQPQQQDRTAAETRFQADPTSGPEPSAAAGMV